MNPDLTIIKLNPERQEMWRYTGRSLQRSAEGILVEAFFNREDMPFHGLVLGKGDRFVEVYFSRRWYNIFEMRDRADDAVKGWYCNITLPAEMDAHEIRYVDLALDLLVYPDGRQLVLDEDEFAALPLDEATRRKANSALEELQALFESVKPMDLKSLLKR